jgi:hypothetical protein
MARPKSIVSTCRAEDVQRAHNCRFDKTHRLERGTRRLTVIENGQDLHYCVPCARQIVERDIENLTKLLQDLSG